MTYEIIKAALGGYRIATRNEHGALIGEAFVDTNKQAKSWVTESKRRARAARIRNRLKSCPWLSA